MSASVGAGEFSIVQSLVYKEGGCARNACASGGGRHVRQGRSVRRSDRRVRGRQVRRSDRADEKIYCAGAGRYPRVHQSQHVLSEERNGAGSRGGGRRSAAARLET